MTAWHAIRARPSAEGRTLVGVEALGLRGYLPVELVRKNYRGSREVMWKPLFPRYVFARLDLGCDVTRVNEIAGVMAIMRAPVAIEIIDAIIRAERSGVFDHTRAARLGHGDTVRVIDGPLASLIGKIRSARPHKRLELVGDFPFRITAGIDKLEKISA